MLMVKLKLAAFGAILALAAGAAELYARLSPQFASGHSWYLGHLQDARQPNAVFGDSQVGASSYLPNTDFFGIAGQQPEEFERVARFVFGGRRPRDVIVMASPQWFGAYHAERPQIMVDSVFPPAWLPLRLGSDLYRRGLKAALRSDGRLFAARFAGAFAVGGARAADLVPPPRAEVVRLSRLWDSALAASGKGLNFPWSDFPEEHRSVLTLSRVFEQNPTRGFETSAAAAAYERGLRFLADRGARICLVRTPVSKLFLSYAQNIPQENYGAFDRYIKSLAARMAVPYVDQNDINLPFGDDMFVNQDHLTYAGHAAYWELANRRCFGG